MRSAGGLERLLDEAVAVVERGGIVGLPTDTVYGLAASPTRAAAIRRLAALKGRDPDKPIALLVASAEQAAGLVVLSPAARALARAHWPGALTLVLLAGGALGLGVGDRERGTVGVRMPDHDLALRLLAGTGPLAVTSANRAGEAPALDEREARALFGGQVDLYLPGRCPGGSASTVVDATVDPPEVLRQGPVELGEQPG